MEKYKNKNNQDQNKEYIKISRKGLRRLGTTALTFGAVSGALKTTKKPKAKKFSKCPQ